MGAVLAARNRRTAKSAVDPIFKNATIGVVGDINLVVPKLIEKFKAKLNK